MYLVKESTFHISDCEIGYGVHMRPQESHSLDSAEAETVVPVDAEFFPARWTPPSRGESDPAEIAQTPAEERANTWSAALGLAGAFGFALALFWRSDATAGQWIFAAALCFLFLTSTLYHALVSEAAKEIARALDHGAIFVLIAATYTPFALGPLRAQGGTLLFGIEWLLAFIGLGFVLAGGHNQRRVSNALYIGMGWLGLLFVSSFLGHVPPTGNGLILAGGIFYTIGVAFYSARRWPYFHFVWHLFVLAGSLCHAIAVYLYAG